MSSNTQGRVPEYEWVPIARGNSTTRRTTSSAVGLAPAVAPKVDYGTAYRRVPRAPAVRHGGRSSPRSSPRHSGRSDALAHAVTALASPAGVEPATSRFVAGPSAQLRYGEKRPVTWTGRFVGMEGLEPRSPAPKAGGLATGLHPDMRTRRETRTRTPEGNRHLRPARLPDSARRAWLRGHESNVGRRAYETQGVSLHPH